MVSLLVFVLVPVAAGMLFGAMARDAGINGDGVEVSVNLLGPGILSGHAESVRLTGDNVNVPHGVVGHLDLTLGDVSLAERTFSTVSGRLTNVTLNGPAGAIVVIDSVQLEGPANRARAIANVSAAEASKVVKSVATTAGVPVDSVQLKDGSLTIESHGMRTDAVLRVAGAALVLDRAGATSAVLLAPAPSEDWQLQSITVTPGGIRLGLNVDAARLARAMSGGARPLQ